jgi:uncharacterized protein (DUF362 family)
VTINRRTFLQAGATGTFGLLAMPRLWAAGDYRVGVGRDTSGYAAAMRAITTSGGWPGAQISGRPVIIKPNLVSAMESTTGATTDPEVTRAVVDLALDNGASEVLIVEAGPNGANFSACGYDFFGGYDPLGRVTLVNLGDQPVTLAPVPGGGLAYSAIFTADLLLDPQAIYISVAKLKTHGELLATLSFKNQFGLPAVDRYVSRPSIGRFAMHDRGIQQAIVDMNMVRPAHFAVIDGVIGMEGLGPSFGTPVRMDMVLAGANPIAVDRVALQAMNVPPGGVRYLLHASRAGLGPADLNAITVSGDPLPQQSFVLPAIAPVIEYPRVVPGTFTPSRGESVTAYIGYVDAVIREIDVLELYEDSTDVRLVRSLAPLAARAGGAEAISWDGRDNDGAAVPPGRYAIHVRAFNPRARTRHADGVGWVTAL